jgi:YD repeat-containing protein
MLVLTPGYSVTLTLNAQDSVFVESRDSVVVEAVSGLGLSPGVIATLDGKQTFGPYAAGQFKLTAIGGDCAYNVIAASNTGGVQLAYDASGNVLGVVAPGGVVPIRSAVRVAFFGDSITQQSMSFGLQINGQPADNFGGQGFTVLWADWSTPAGAGTLVYDQTAKTLQWTPFGLSAGAAVDASTTGILRIPGPSNDTGLWVNWFGKSRPYTSGSTSVTVKADGSQQWNWVAYGFPVQAMAYAGQRFVWANYSGLPGGKACYGIGGARINDMNDAKPQWGGIVSDIDVIEIGTNSCSAGYPGTPTFTAAQMIADLKTLIDTRRAVTPVVIVCTIPPKSTSNETIAMQQQRSAVNQWIFDYCKTATGLIPFDLNALVSDPTNGLYLSGYSYDSVHPSNIGAQTIGYALAQVMLSLSPTQSGVHLPGYFDTFDATYNPYGNMLPTAGMATFEGTGGTAGTGASGTVPTGYTMSRDSGAAMTGTGSKVARTDSIPGNWYQVQLAGAVANENIALRTPGITSAVAGETVEALLEVNVPSSSLLYAINVTLVPGGVTGRSASSFAASSMVHKDSMGKLWLRTAPYTIPAGATSVAPYINMSTQNGGSATIQLGRLVYRKVRPGF